VSEESEIERVERLLAERRQSAEDWSRDERLEREKRRRGIHRKIDELRSGLREHLGLASDELNEILVAFQEARVYQEWQDGLLPESNRLRRDLFYTTDQRQVLREHRIIPFGDPPPRRGFSALLDGTLLIGGASVGAM
jgi:hypothetical protein